MTRSLVNTGVKKFCTVHSVFEDDSTKQNQKKKDIQELGTGESMVTMQPESTKPWASFRKGHLVRVRAGVGAFMLTHLTISCTCVPAFIAIKAAGHLYSYSS